MYVYTWSTHIEKENNNTKNIYRWHEINAADERKLKTARDVDVDVVDEMTTSTYWRDLWTVEPAVNAETVIVGSSAELLNKHNVQF